jgi:DNA-binding HxlR family transcriptional regulator/putative sterol carrier protein
MAESPRADTADGRTYGDRCGVARALDAVGERWALLVVRELLYGPKRFSDLYRGLGGVSQNVLSQRLRELERAGVVRRRRLGPPVGAAVYELTEAGAALEPVLLALGSWGRLRPFPTNGTFSIDAFMLALQTTFDAGAEPGLRVVVNLRIGDDEFTVDVRDGRFAIARGHVARADVTVEGNMQTIRDLAFGTRRVKEAMRSGDLRADGNTKALRRLFDAFAKSDVAEAAS